MIPFDRLEARVHRSLRRRDGVVHPGDLVVLPAPASFERPGSHQLAMCPRCASLLTLTPEHVVDGPDEAPTVHGSIICPPCGAHWFVREGHVVPLGDVPAQHQYWRARQVIPGTSLV